jgi:solute:Na+ symporter, SSS family
LPLNGQYETILYTAYSNAKGEYAIPFLVQMGWVFCFTCLIMVVVSLLDKQPQNNTMEIDSSLFKLSPRILLMVLLIAGLVLSLYIKFW